MALNNTTLNNTTSVFFF